MLLMWRKSQQISHSCNTETCSLSATDHVRHVQSHFALKITAPFLMHYSDHFDLYGVLFTASMCLNALAHSHVISCNVSGGKLTFCLTNTDICSHLAYCY